MAGSYGAENPQNERYRLSFTVGGLLALQGKILATLFVENEHEYTTSDVESTNGTTAIDHENRGTHNPHPQAGHRRERALHPHPLGELPRCQRGIETVECTHRDGNPLPGRR